jgi:hypothetical protein
MTPYSKTNDTTNGRITGGALTAMPFIIGCEVAGSSAAGQNTQANQTEEAFCALSEVARVVAN